MNLFLFVEMSAYVCYSHYFFNVVSLLVSLICSGCIYTVALRDVGVSLCPFCRTPAPLYEETIEKLNKRVELGDVHRDKMKFYI